MQREKSTSYKAGRIYVGFDEEYTRILRQNLDENQLLNKDLLILWFLLSMRVSKLIFYSRSKQFF